MNTVIFLAFGVELFDINVPLLVGLKLLCFYGDSIDLTRTKIIRRNRNWENELTRKHGHFYMV